MADLHIAPTLHAASVDALEAALDFSLEVVGPAIKTELVVTVESKFFAIFEHLVANHAVAFILAWETRTHFWMLCGKLLLKF